jgi:hypothetical protein
MCAFKTALNRGHTSRHDEAAAKNILSLEKRQNVVFIKSYQTCIISIQVDGQGINSPTSMYYKFFSKFLPFGQILPGTGFVKMFYEDEILHLFPGSVIILWRAVI